MNGQSIWKTHTQWMYAVIMFLSKLHTSKKLENIRVIFQLIAWPWIFFSTYLHMSKWGFETFDMTFSGGNTQGFWQKILSHHPPYELFLSWAWIKWVQRVFRDWFSTKKSYFCNFWPKAKGSGLDVKVKIFFHISWHLVRISGK